MTPEQKELLRRMLENGDYSLAEATARDLRPKDPKPSPLFNLPSPPRWIERQMTVRPPILSMCSEEELQQLRIACVLAHLSGEVINKWSKNFGDLAKSWEHTLQLDAAARMIFFQTRAQEEHEKALARGATTKYIPLGNDVANKPGDELYFSCNPCREIQKIGTVPINYEYSPGVLYGPFAQCTHHILGCRCMMMYGFN